jgi:hypothetical protein
MGIVGIVHRWVHDGLAQGVAAHGLLAIRPRPRGPTKGAQFAHPWVRGGALMAFLGGGAPCSPEAPTEPSGTGVGGTFRLKLDRLSLIIRVAGYALRFFPGAPSDTPSLDAC